MESWLKPMLSKAVDVVPEGAEWTLEPKLDGWRMLAHRINLGPNEPYPVKMYAGRNGTEYTGKLPYVDEILERILPPDTALDGEMVSGAWGDVQGVMTRGNGPHVPSEAVPALTYVVFDVLRVAGDDARALPWRERRRLLEMIEFESHVILCATGPATQQAHEELLALGLEGSVAKRVDSPYSNSRSGAWVKIKPQTTDEAKVVGFKEGTPGSAFDGMVGALELEMLDSGARTRASGMDMTTRKQISDNRDAWMGVVVEIKHHGLGENGVPRHPQFLRRRDDRTAVPAPPVRTAPKVTTKTTKRMRNYGAMGNAKLLRVRSELANGGDAAERCGPENVARDLAAVNALVQERGL